MSEEAKRTPCDIRLDLISPTVLLEIAKVFALGAKRYGDFNWQKSRLKGENSFINHVLKYIVNYQVRILDEDSEDLKVYLTYAIVNLMFEYWYEENQK